METLPQKTDEKRDGGGPYAFVPHRLEISWKPELYQFPFNILFMGSVVRNGIARTASSLYEPEFFTFDSRVPFSSLRYRNVYGGDDSILIGYDLEQGTRQGLKVVNGQLVADFRASDWHEFFIGFTAAGVTPGESIKIMRK